MAAKRYLADEGDATPLTNLVFMVRQGEPMSLCETLRLSFVHIPLPHIYTPHLCQGMCKPLHNLEAVLAYPHLYDHTHTPHLCYAPHLIQGMGEPLHNLEAVLSSIDIMTHPLGLHLSRNKVGHGTTAVHFHAAAADYVTYCAP